MERMSFDHVDYMKSKTRRISSNKSSVTPRIQLLMLCVWLCVCVCVCVCVCSISAQAFETGVFMFELRSRNSLCVAVCCVGVCVYVPSQLKHSRQGSLCLSWACHCPNPSHSVPPLYPTSKHMPLIHFLKGLLYCSYFILILFLLIIIHYHHLFTPHSSSSSTSCPAIPFQWMWGNTNISAPRFKYYLCPSNWVQSISIRHDDNTIYKTISSLCVYCSVYLLYSITVILIYPDSYGTFSTCQVHFIPIKGVWYTLYADTGHKYSNPPPTLCHVICHSLCVSHRSTNPTGRWWIQPPMELFKHVRSTSYLLKAFGILYVMLIQPGHKYSTPTPTPYSMSCHMWQHRPSG